MKTDTPKAILPDEVDDQPYIFISYSHCDKDRIQEILQVLRSNGFRFWYDIGLKYGNEWAEELGEKIDQCEQFMVLITENSVNSKFVLKEISMAVRRDKKMLVVYLKETALTNGMEYFLGDTQALHREQYRRKTDFEQELCKATSKNTLKAAEKTFSFFALEDTYELMQKIGVGSESEVYLARHKRTNSLVAVKCSSFEKNYVGRITKELFRSEKGILAILSQKLIPHVPMLFDYYEDGKQVFLVESFVDGVPLNAKAGAVWSEKEVVEIAKKVLKILQDLHESNVVHMDIKPGNLIMNEIGDVYMIDFSISKMLNSPFGVDGIMGTPGFAAPEVFMHSVNSFEIGFAADIYSLGRTMEYLLCPNEFSREGPAPVRYYRKDISSELEVIIEKMTAVNPNDRYRNAEEVFEALDAIHSVDVFQRLKNYFHSRSAAKSFEKMKAIRMKDKAIRMKQRELDIREIEMELELLDDNTIRLSLPKYKNDTFETK